MFEKEAEEKYCKGCILRIEQCLWAWRNTNGLNEPSEKNCSCKEVPAYIAGAEFGYNKANEWHFVKDGDLPNCTRKVLICYGKEEHMKFVYWRADLGTFGSALPVEITAWRYIESPKEEE